MVAMDLGHPCWVLIDDFLAYEESRRLLALNKAVVDSPLRLRFFELSTWHVPNTERIAARVTKALTVKNSIVELGIQATWQQAYIPEFPKLESVKIGCPVGRGFVLSSGLMTNLRTLRVSTTELDMSALNPLANGKLKRLELCQERLCNHEQLQFFPNVEELFLDHLIEEEFEWSKKVPNICWLDATASDMLMSAFKPLSNITSLSLSECTNLDLDILVCLAPNLKSLNLMGAIFEGEITDEDADTFVASLLQIEVLELRGTDLPRTLKPLSNLKALRTLGLDNMVEHDITPLGKLTDLEALYFSSDAYVDWRPLAKLKKLRLLVLSEDIFDYNESFSEAISKLPALRTLVNCYQLDRQYPLPQITTLEIGHSGLPAAKIELWCSSLESLSVKGCFMLESIAECYPRLKELDIVHLTRFPDFRPLAVLTELKSLKLPISGSRFFDYRSDFGSDEPDSSTSDEKRYHGFTFLKGMTQMVELEIHDGPIHDLSVLRNMKKLQKLVITSSSARITDLAVLVELPLLHRLRLDGTSIRDVSGLRGHPSLHSVDLPDVADCSTLNDDDGLALPNIVRLLHGSGPRDCRWCEHPPAFQDEFPSKIVEDS